MFIVLSKEISFIFFTSVTIKKFEKLFFVLKFYLGAKKS